MVKYVLKDLQTGKQVDTVESPTFEDATHKLLVKSGIKKYLYKYESSGNMERSTIFIAIQLPYGASYKYEVGAAED